MDVSPNPGKSISITVRNQKFQRYPIKSKLISSGDDIASLIMQYVGKNAEENDVIVISERIVAVSQGRSFLIQDIKPSWWALQLSKYVYKHPGGIGLRSPWTMQLAINEAGLWRLLIASCVSIILKPFGIRGMFYRIAGNNINAIDGPCEYTLPPGNKSAKLGPKNPQAVAQNIEDSIGNGVVIIDANDYGVNVLGLSSKAKKSNLPIKEIFRDNPMGQSREQTPIVLLRRE